MQSLELCAWRISIKCIKCIKSKCLPFNVTVIQILGNNSDITFPTSGLLSSVECKSDSLSCFSYDLVCQSHYLLPGYLLLGLFMVSGTSKRLISNYNSQKVA